MKKESDDLILLRRYIKRKGSLGLAIAINYRSQSAINNWLKRGHIPGHVRKQVLEIIKGAKE